MKDKLRLMLLFAYAFHSYLCSLLFFSLIYRSYLLSLSFRVLPFTQIQQTPHQRNKQQIARITGTRQKQASNMSEELNPH